MGFVIGTFFVAMAFPEHLGKKIARIAKGFHAEMQAVQ